MVRRSRFTVLTIGLLLTMASARANATQIAIGSVVDLSSVPVTI